MKKKTKAKQSKRSSKQSSAPEPEMPGLVAAMAKLVERFEAMDRKIDQVLGRVSNLQRPQSQSHSLQPAPQQPRQNFNPPSEGQRQRTLYQAVCADCHKNCELPFKPGDRPVYCKECFAIRKAGHTPQNPDRGSAFKKLFIPSPMDYTPPPAPSKSRKQKFSKSKAGKKR